MSGSELLFLGTVVTANSVIERGALVVQTPPAGGRILYAGSVLGLPHPYQDLPDQSVPGTKFLLPGLIDLHCHGGAGISFPDCDSLDAVAQGADEHLRHGTTTLVASLVTATIEELEQKAALLATAVEVNYIHAFHFEGPFISATRCGAQDPQKIQKLTPENAQRLVQAARGQAFSITIAPEQVCTPLGKQGLQILVEGNLLPSWGHTAASLKQTRQGVATGFELLSKNPRHLENSSVRPATVTHMFNGMDPLHHRHPGPIPEFLAAAKRSQLLVELICDGIHLDLQLVVSMVELLGRDSIIFVTDAMAATGMPEGEYVLGGQRVQVKGGAAYLDTDGCLAGGISHLLEQVQLATTAGISLCDACFMASTSPARALGLADRGQLHTGLRADFLAVDQNFQPLGVWRQGARV